MGHLGKSFFRQMFTFMRLMRGSLVTFFVQFHSPQHSIRTCFLLENDDNYEIVVEQIESAIYIFLHILIHMWSYVYIYIYVHLKIPISLYYRFQNMHTLALFKRNTLEKPRLQPRLGHRWIPPLDTCPNLWNFWLFGVFTRGPFDGWLATFNTHLMHQEDSVLNQRSDNPWNPMNY